MISEFYPTGELKRNYGSRTYPAGYGYDYAGRLKTMTNWTSFATGAGERVTTWNYDSQRGWLSGKTYDGGAAGPSYTYTSAGRLNTRTWARNLTTTYTYDNAGGLYTVAYSDSTPGITYSCDRLGREATILQNGMTTTLAYNLAGQPLSESYSGGILNGLSVTNGYDTFLRRTNLVARNSTSQLIQDSYFYDAASRLRAVSDGNNNSAGYIYLVNSPLVGQILFTNSGSLRMTTTRQFDFLNRLTSISSVGTGSTPSPVSFNYAYNSPNQRTCSTEADSSYWRYQYDSLGQVASGKKYWPDQTPVAGQQFEYGFDDIGNRALAKAGGDKDSSNLRSASYTANNLNQYTSREVPGAFDVIGLELATNSVTVNSATPYRKGEYFRKEVAVNNGSTSVWQSVTVSAPETSQSGHVYVPKTSEAFSYDADGNLTSDGRWSYAWDAENRLIQLVANTGVGPQQLIKLEHDSKGRRIHKQVWPNTSGTGNPTNDLKFLYGGWNLLADLDHLNASTVLRSYAWGLDLNGSLQGAGGIGGLLEVSYYGIQTTNCFVTFDGNGNVASLANVADGKLLAQYGYGPFGEVLRATGPMAKVNPLHFSTKYQDDETDLLYYGYRYYSATMGRWFSRDPMEEDGGINFYGYVANLPNSSIDPVGLATHSGGAQALIPTDVNFGGKKIGSVQAWKNVGVDDGVEDAMWIELTKDPGCPECKWAQFVRNNHLDKNGAKRNFWAPVTIVRWRHSDEWYLDVLGRDGWMFRPSESRGSIEAIWDGPGEVKGNMISPWVKSLMEFESILLCQIKVPCESGTEVKWKPAFQVSWSLTQELPDWAKVYQASGKSITDLPKFAAGPFWIAGYEYNNGVPNRKLPVLVRNPTF